MKKNVNKGAEQEHETEKRITVRLDNRTVITLKSMESFENWKERYPDARIVAAA